MSTRHWIKVVFFVGILLAASLHTCRLFKRRAHYLALVEAHESRRIDYGEGRGDMCIDGIYFENGELKPAFSRYLDELSNYFGLLERKYRYAASHPWLTIPPDPPAPEYGGICRVRRRCEIACQRGR